MTTASKVLIAVVIIVAISGGALAWALSSHNSNDDNKTNTSQTNNNNNGGSDNNNNQNGDQNIDQATPTEVTIIYNGNSFSSSSNSIQAGGTVTVINESKGDLAFDSDPHPVHTDNPELNAGEIPAGSRKSFVLTTAGTWGFHNHLNSSQRGSIEVR